MIAIDSSGWIEFFTDGQLADDYASRLRKLTTVITPVIVIHEVYKRLKRDLSEDDAIVAVSGVFCRSAECGLRRSIFPRDDLRSEKLPEPEEQR